MDLNSIMSNIYGENAPQSFDSLHLSGGNIVRRVAKIKYLDDDTKSTTTDNDDVSSYIAAAYSYRANKISPIINNAFSISGGAKQTKIYSSAEYIEDEGLKAFIKEFDLHHKVVNTKRNTIFVIPSKTTLQKMIDEFKDKLKKEGIEEYTQEASLYSSKTDLPYKNYIFNVYGKNGENNDTNYHVPAGFPDTGEYETILIRTNLLSNIYYFKFISESEIRVSANENMTKYSTLKFIAKAANECFILKGDLPPASDKKASNVVTATLSGGNKKNYLKNYFLSLVQKNEEDIDSAAYKFIGAIGAAEDDIQETAKKLSKYYSGDYLHTAFSILADNQEFDVNENVKDKTVDKVHSAIIDYYKPKKSVVKMNKVNEVLPMIYRNCKSSPSGKEASKMFVSTLKKMYNTISSPSYMMRADIATALCKQNSNYQSVRNALNVIDEVKKIEDNPTAFDGPENNSSYFNSSIRLNNRSVISPLVSTIYGAISSSPFIGSIAKEYTPLLMTKSKSHKEFKPKKAFEDDKNVDDNDDVLRFSILNDEDTNKEKTKENDEERTKEKTKEDVDSVADIDIKSFF